MPRTGRGLCRTLLYAVWDMSGQLAGAETRHFCKKRYRGTQQYNAQLVTAVTSLRPAKEASQRAS